MFSNIELVKKPLAIDQRPLDIIHGKQGSVLYAIFKRQEMGWTNEAGGAAELP